MKKRIFIALLGIYCHAFAGIPIHDESELEFRNLAELSAPALVFRMIEDGQNSVDMLRNDCHGYVNGYKDGRLTFSPAYGRRNHWYACDEYEKYFSSSHENEGLGDGDMFAFAPPDSPRGFDARRPWNASMSNSVVDIGLNSTVRDFPHTQTHSGRFLNDGYLGVFLNFPLQLSFERDYEVELEFDLSDFEQEDIDADEARVTLGMVTMTPNGAYRFMEFVLLRTANWDYCQFHQHKGSVIAELPCDPTESRMIDYRSLNPPAVEIGYPGSEIVYLNTANIFPPEVTPRGQARRYRYQFPFSDLFRSFPWTFDSGDGREIQTLGFYVGIEHHGGAKTRIKLKKFRFDVRPHRGVASNLVMALDSEFLKTAEVSGNGEIEQVSMDENGVTRIRGWHCATEPDNPAELQLYLRQVGEQGLGIPVGTIRPDVFSEASAVTCRSDADHVFEALLDADLSRNYVGYEVLIAAPNEGGDRTDKDLMLLNHSARFTIPSAADRVTELDGGLLSVTWTIDAGLHLTGWACVPGAHQPTRLHIYSPEQGDTALTEANFLGARFTNIYSLIGSRRCGSDGNHGFDIRIPLPESQVNRLMGAQVVAVSDDPDCEECYRLLSED